MRNIRDFGDADLKTTGNITGNIASYLTLDQSTPQTVTGYPTFQDGITLGSYAISSSNGYYLSNLNQDVAYFASPSFTSITANGIYASGSSCYMSGSFSFSASNSNSILISDSNGSLSAIGGSDGLAGIYSGVPAIIPASSPLLLSDDYLSLNYGGGLTVSSSQLVLDSSVPVVSSDSLFESSQTTSNTCLTHAVGASADECWRVDLVWDISTMTGQATVTVSWKDAYNVSRSSTITVTPPNSSQHNLVLALNAYKGTDITVTVSIGSSLTSKLTAILTRLK